ncbi:MAG: PRC-barrel domain-containing protein [Candidatus Peribacteraceae bacterium]|nr:PRC-barrel domain-containing protein [Candidatus Peribacteraceae bacterium]
MHVRFSTCRGLPVVDASCDAILGRLSGVVLNPDTGKVEGFTVHVPGLLSGSQLFCAGVDILRWGTHILVRDGNVLSPTEDRIRLQELLEQHRPLLGQRIRTESGRILGICADVQIDTLKMLVTWIFPKRLWRWGIAIPLTEVVEVRRDAIIVHDPPIAKKSEVTVSEVIRTLPSLKDITETGSCMS